MEVADATRMIRSESAPHPELLREAARKDVCPALRARYGAPAFNAVVLALGREIDRLAPVPVTAR